MVAEELTGSKAAKAAFRHRSSRVTSRPSTLIPASAFRSGRRRGGFRRQLRPLSRPRCPGRVRLSQFATIPGCGADRSTPSIRPLPMASGPMMPRPGVPARRCAFGRTGLLNETQVNDAAEFVLSLSGRAADKAAAERGAKIFVDNCAPCHGRKAKATRRSARRTSPISSGFTAGTSRQCQTVITTHRRDARLGQAPRSGDDQGACHLRAFAGRGSSNRAFETS